MDREGHEVHQSEGRQADAVTQPGQPQHRSRDMIPREYLRIIAVWSLVPSYAIAGGFLGYAADRWLETFPYLTGLGLLLALALAVRDMYRLRDAM